VVEHAGDEGLGEGAGLGGGQRIAGHVVAGGVREAEVQVGPVAHALRGGFGREGGPQPMPARHLADHFAAEDRPVGGGEARGGGGGHLDLQGAVLRLHRFGL